jgi:hypothetical protein
MISSASVTVPDRGLRGGERGGVGDRGDAEVGRPLRPAALAEAAHDRRLFLGARVRHQQLEQEAVELRFGQRVDALALDRVLRRDDHEAVGERMALAVERHAPLLHRLEQRGLGLGRGAVDLVGEQQLVEDRPRSA